MSFPSYFHVLPDALSRIARGVPEKRGTYKGLVPLAHLWSVALFLCENRVLAAQTAAD